MVANTPFGFFSRSRSVPQVSVIHGLSPLQAQGGQRRSVMASSVLLETPALGERYSDFMYTKQSLKKRKEGLCFKQ